MRKRPLQLADYGISVNRFRELESFVRQHEEKKEKLAAIREGRVRLLSSGRRNMGGHGDPTWTAVIRGERYQRDIEAVENAANEAAGIMAGELLRNIIDRVPWERLDIPCGREGFYKIRRRFYCLLDEKMR